MADDNDSKQYFGREPDYMRESETRIGICSFDFADLKDTSRLETISKEEQEANRIAKDFNRAAQREQEAQIEAPSSEEEQGTNYTAQNVNKAARQELGAQADVPKYRESLPIPQPPYRPLTDNVPIRLPHRVPAFPLNSRGTVGDLVDRVKVSFRDVDITTTDCGRSRASKIFKTWESYPGPNSSPPSKEYEHDDFYDGLGTEKSEVV